MIFASEPRTGHLGRGDDRCRREGAQSSRDSRGPGKRWLASSDPLKWFHVAALQVLRRVNWDLVVRDKAEDHDRARLGGFTD